MPARGLRELPIALNLYESVKRGGGAIRNVSKQIGETWRRSIRGVGGFWIGTAVYAGDPVDLRYELQELFLEGMMREVRETLGGLTTWQGFIGDMTLTLGGVRYTRSLLDRANAVKAIYSRLGDNLFTDGSAESAAWAAYGTPSTREQSTTWVSDGIYSCHLITDGSNEGAQIESGLAVVADKPYECRVTIKLVTGTWKLEISRGDTGAVLGQASESTAGQRVLRATISDSSTFTGSVTVRLYASLTGAEIYADGAGFQSGPERAETGWYEDAAGEADYGQIEDILLEAGMSDDAANAKAQTELTKRAWPRTLPQSNSRQALAIGQDQLGQLGLRLGV